MTSRVFLGIMATLKLPNNQRLYLTVEHIKHHCVFLFVHSCTWKLSEFLKLLFLSTRTLFRRNDEVSLYRSLLGPFKRSTMPTNQLLNSKL